MGEWPDEHIYEIIFPDKTSKIFKLNIGEDLSKIFKKYTGKQLSSVTVNDLVDKGYKFYYHGKLENISKENK